MQSFDNEGLTVICFICICQMENHPRQKYIVRGDGNIFAYPHNSYLEYSCNSAYQMRSHLLHQSRQQMGILIKTLNMYNIK